MPIARPWWSLDVESSGVFPEYGLQPWRVAQGKAWLTTIAMSKRTTDGELRSRGMIYPNKAAVRAILQAAVDARARIVGWNIAFDIMWLIAYGCQDLVDQLDFLDAMLLWKHHDMIPTFQGRHPYSLKGEGGGVATWCPEMGAYEEGVSYHGRSREELEKLLGYNMKDTEATLIVAEKVWEDLLPTQRAAAITETYTLPLVAAANLEGMFVDRPALAKLGELMDAQEAKAAALLAPHGITEKVVRSPKQLSAMMFDVWNLPQIKQRSTDAEVLEELALMDDRADQLGDYREALNLKGKFYGGLTNSCEYNGDGKTRPAAKIFGTYTSRMSYSSKQSKKEGSTSKNNTLQTGFALHQMKNDKAWRATIVAPEGYDIVEADAAGQEFRWMAIHTQDNVMLGLCMPGEDAHSFMGASCFGIPYEDLRGWHAADDPRAKVPRKQGKVANLSLQYRTSDKTFRIRAKTDHGLRLSATEATKIVSTYRTSYIGVPKWWASQIALGKKLGYAETLAGRRLVVEGNWTGSFKWSMESSMINYPIQGTGGDQKYLALRVLKNILSKYGARFAWDLHDGIYFYVPKAVSMKFAVEMKLLLDNLPYAHAWGFKSPIPLPWDVKLGSSWGGLKQLEL